MSESTIAPAFDIRAAFRALPRAVMMDVLAKDAIMRELSAGRGLAAMCRAIAERHRGRRGFSAPRLRSQFYLWQRAGGTEGGAFTLVDHSRCCGCGLPGCTQSQASRLSQDVVDVWLSKAIANKKRALKESWRAMVRALARGESIAGKNWRAVFRESHPGMDVPDVCPWSEAHPPPGWSLSNFMARKGSDLVYRAARDGMSKVASALPQVRMDFSQLRPLEAVVFDDHRLDFHVYVTDRMGRTQIVELWGLFAMDVATRSVIHFGLRPKLLREDGTTEGLTRRDMQHLIAAILAEYGYPTSYKTHLIVENAAAAVSPDTERLIEHHTRGQVVVHRTGVRCNDVVLSGFPEKWGNPRGKSWLESWFNPLDIALGEVKGQTGSSYEKQPAEYEARLRVANRVKPMLDMMTEAEREAFKAPLLWAGAAHQIVSDVIAILNERTDHECVGFDTRPYFRWSANDGALKPAQLSPGLPAAIRKEVEVYLQLPPNLQEHLITAHGAWRRESPAEKMRRCYRARDFVKLDGTTFADLMLDMQRLTYNGGGTVEVRVKRGRNEEIIQFSGAVGADLGEEIEVRFDADRPGAGAWLVAINSQGDAGRVLGHLRHHAKPGAFRPEDADALRRRLGAVQKAQGEIAQAARRITRDAIRQHVSEAESNLEIARTIALPSPERAPALAVSHDLLRQINRDTSKARITAAEQALLDMNT